MSDSHTNRRPRAWLWGSIAVLALTLTGLLLSYSEPQAIPDAEPGLLPVTVVEAAPQSRQLMVEATGITEPHWPTAIVATVVTAVVTAVVAGHSRAG